MTIDPNREPDTTPAPGQDEPAPDPGPIVPSPGPSEQPTIDTPDPDPQPDPELGGLASRDEDQTAVDREVSPD